MERKNFWIWSGVWNRVSSAAEIEQARRRARGDSGAYSASDWIREAILEKLDRDGFGRKRKRRTQKK